MSAPAEEPADGAAQQTRATTEPEATERPPATAVRATSGLVRKVLLASLLGAGAFVALAAFADLAEMRRALAAYPLGWLALAFGLAAGNYALRIVRWELYLRALDIRVPAGESALIFLSGFVMSVTPGKVGEVFKSLLLYESRGVPVARTAPIVIAERVTDVAALVLLMALGSFAFPRGAWMAALGAAGLTLLVALVLSRRLAGGVLSLLRRTRLGARAAPRLEEAYESLRILSRPRLFVTATLVGLAAWSLECLALHAILHGFGHAAAVLESTFAYSASTMVGAVAMLPGGLGLTEASMTGLLLALRPGTSRVVASGATILVRLATLWFAVVLGALSFALFRFTRRRAARPGA